MENRLPLVENIFLKYHGKQVFHNSMDNKIQLVENKIPLVENKIPPVKLFSTNSMEIKFH